MKSTNLLIYVAFFSFICTIGDFLVIMFGLKSQSYEDLIATGIISISASCLIMAVALLDIADKVSNK